VIYFIMSDEVRLVKIGFTTRPLERLRCMQTTHYHTLSLLRCEEGKKGAEYWLHWYVSEHRAVREWFSYCDEMMTVRLPSEAMINDDPDIKAIIAKITRDKHHKWVKNPCSGKSLIALQMWLSRQQLSQSANQ